MGAKDHLDLEKLADKYEVLGELGGREDARSYLGTRREDNKPILITVSREPAGDAGNALSHLGADINLLAGVRHRNLVPIIEARWLGTDALAVITERVTAPSLEEQIARREVEFPYPRISAILQEINGVLEWARAQKVVHRAIRLDSVFVEPGSDQVYVMFTLKSLPVTGIPGEMADAQTIAFVARAMLTRSVADPERDKLSLAELRPGLPSRVVEQTDQLLDPATPPAKAPDVRGYIAAIAMAEELKRGETECQRVTTEMAEEQRMTREALAAERKAHEDDLAAQARKFAKEKEDATRALQKEKEELLRAVTKEREEMTRTLAKEKEELSHVTAKERKELQRAAEKERDALAKERAAFARERAALEKDRAAFERASVKSREQIAAKLAALQAQSELYARTSELPIAAARHSRFVEDFTRPDDPEEIVEEVEDLDSIVEESKDVDEIVAEAEDVDEIVEGPEELIPIPATAERIAPQPVHDRPLTERHVSAVAPALHASRPAWRDRVRGKRALRRVGVGGAIVVVLIAVTLFATGRGEDRDTTPAQRAQGVRLVDSMAGGVGPPLTTVDSSALVPTLDSVPAPRPRRERPVRRQVVAPPPDTTQIASSQRDSSARQDTLFGPLPFAPRDTVSRDSVTRRDTTARRDTTVRRDTSRVRSDTGQRRDTLPRPDTMTAKRGEAP